MSEQKELVDSVTIEEKDASLTACATTLKWLVESSDQITKCIIKRAGVEFPDLFANIAEVTDHTDGVYEYKDVHGSEDELGHYYQIEAIKTNGTCPILSGSEPSKIQVVGQLHGNYKPSDTSEIEQDFKLKNSNGIVIGVRMWVKTNAEEESSPAGCKRSRPVNFFCENYGTSGTADPKLWASDNGECGGGELRRVVVFLKTSEMTWCAERNSEREGQPQVAPKSRVYPRKSKN